MSDEKKRIVTKRKKLIPKMHYGNELAADGPEERTWKYSVSREMLVPLRVTERTSGLEEGRSEGHHWVCFISLLIQSFHSLPAGFSIALGSLIFKSFTVISVHSLRDHLHDLIFLTIWKWKDFSWHLTGIFLLYLFFFFFSELQIQSSQGFMVRYFDLFKFEGSLWWLS